VIIPLNGHKSQAVKDQADALYEQFRKQGIDVLLDDRNERAGALFADQDLIGIPHRLVVSDRNIEQNSVEYKSRATGETQLLALDKAVDVIVSLRSK
jgi:prolyl-tRNA synthetase